MYVYRSSTKYERISYYYFFLFPSKSTAYRFLQTSFLRRNIANHSKVPKNPPAATPQKREQRYRHFWFFGCVTRNRYVWWKKCFGQRQKILVLVLSVYLYPRLFSSSFSLFLSIISHDNLHLVKVYFSNCGRCKKCSLVEFSPYAILVAKQTTPPPRILIFQSCTICIRVVEFL